MKSLLIASAGSLLVACSPAAAVQTSSSSAAVQSQAQAVQPAAANAATPTAAAQGAAAQAAAAQGAATQAAPGKNGGDAPAGQPPADTNGAAPAAVSAADQAVMQTLVSLILGTLKLEGTSNAVTNTQAATLIPLWQEYQTLSNSLRPTRGNGKPGQDQTQATPAADTSQLQAKLEDLVTRIKASMTAEQLKAIEDMAITQDNMQDIIQELGITLSGPGKDGGGQPQDANGQPPQGDQLPQGTPPADSAGGGQPPDGNGGPGRGGGLMIQPGLVEALLTALGKIKG